MALGVAAYGVGKSIYDTIQEGKNKSDAAAALRNLEVPELTNAADGLAVSTLGADYKRGLVSQNAANSVDALRGSGTRGIVGGVGSVAAGVDNASTEIAADLDAQQKQIDMFRANDAINIRGINENRFNADKSALSSQYDAASDAQKQAEANTLQSGAWLAYEWKNRNKTSEPKTTSGYPGLMTRSAGSGMGATANPDAYGRYGYPAYGMFGYGTSNNY